MRFSCSQCQTQYRIDDAKIAGKIVRIRCRACGAIIEVRDPALEDQATTTQDPATDGTPASSEGVSDGWYAAIDNSPVGPMDMATMRAHITAGRVDAESLVWKAPMGEWAKAETVEELRSSFTGSHRPDEPAADNVAPPVEDVVAPTEPPEAAPNDESSESSEDGDLTTVDLIPTVMPMGGLPYEAPQPATSEATPDVAPEEVATHGDSIAGQEPVEIASEPVVVEAAAEEETIPPPPPVARDIQYTPLHVRTIVPPAPADHDETASPIDTGHGDEAEAAPSENPASSGEELDTDLAPLPENSLTADQVAALEAEHENFGATVELEVRKIREHHVAGTAPAMPRSTDAYVASEPESAPVEATSPVEEETQEAETKHPENDSIQTLGTEQEHSEASEHTDESFVEPSDPSAGTRLDDAGEVADSPQDEDLAESSIPREEAPEAHSTNLDPTEPYSADSPSPAEDVVNVDPAKPEELESASPEIEEVFAQPVPSGENDESAPAKSSKEEPPFTAETLDEEQSVTEEKLDEEQSVTEETLGEELTGVEADASQTPQSQEMEGLAELEEQDAESRVTSSEDAQQGETDAVNDEVPVADLEERQAAEGSEETAASAEMRPPETGSPLSVEENETTIDVVPTVSGPSTADDGLGDFSDFFDAPPSEELEAAVLEVEAPQAPTKEEKAYFKAQMREASDTLSKSAVERISEKDKEALRKEFALVDTLDKDNARRKRIILITALFVFGIIGLGIYMHSANQGPPQPGHAKNTDDQDPWLNRPEYEVIPEAKDTAEPEDWDVNEANAGPTKKKRSTRKRSRVKKAKKAPARTKSSMSKAAFAELAKEKRGKGDIKSAGASAMEDNRKAVEKARAERKKQMASRRSMMVRKILRSKAGQLVKCRDNTEEKLRVTIVLTPKGTIHKLDVTGGSSTKRGCVKKVFRRTVFPRGEARESYTGRYTI